MVGLGNPGSEYARTRHNVGFRVVEMLARRRGAGPWRASCHSLVCEAALGASPARPAVFALPQTYMNRSGLAVKALMERWAVPLDHLLVVHDDLDLALGVLRVRAGGGHGGHNGLRSLLEVLGSGEFSRVKIGIGRPEGKSQVVDHVLSPFSPDEEALVPTLLERAADAVEAVALEGALGAMNRFNEARRMEG